MTWRLEVADYTRPQKIRRGKESGDSRGEKLYTNRLEKMGK